MVWPSSCASSDEPRIDMGARSVRGVLSEGTMQLSLLAFSGPFVALTVGACSGGPVPQGADARPVADAEVPAGQLATAVISTFSGPSADRVVLFGVGDVVTATVRTDDEGRASAPMSPNGWVTFSHVETRTVLGVNPGDTIEFHIAYPFPALGGALDVAWTAPQPTIDRYKIYGDCVEETVSLSVQARVNFYAEPRCATGFMALLEAESGGVPVAFQSVFVPATNAPVVFPGPWVSPQEGSVEILGVPANVDTLRFQLAESAGSYVFNRSTAEVPRPASTVVEPFRFTGLGDRAIVGVALSRDGLLPYSTYFAGPNAAKQVHDLARIATPVMGLPVTFDSSTRDVRWVQQGEGRRDILAVLLCAKSCLQVWTFYMANPPDPQAVRLPNIQAPEVPGFEDFRSALVTGIRLEGNTWDDVKSTIATHPLSPTLKVPPGVDGGLSISGGV